MAKESRQVASSRVVFLSYAWADEQTALAVDQWLRNKGVRVLIDRRDFIPGNDIEAEIVRCISAAGKIVCLFSQHSAHRPYPELERRIASALEKQHVAQTIQSRRLIYFKIDSTPLPLEALPRLAIEAFRFDFEMACQELWRAILKRGADPKEIDISQFFKEPPWSTPKFDILKDDHDIDKFYE